MDGPKKTKVNHRQNKVHSIWVTKAIGKLGKEPPMADSDLIQICNIIRYLGGFLDQSLTFNNNISQKIKAAMGNFPLIKSVRKYLSKDACATLALMLCISHLDYGNALL